MRTDSRRFRVVTIVAGALLAPLVLAHISVSVVAFPQFAGMFQSMGGDIPAPTSFILAVGPWLGLLLAVVDVLVFWGFYRLARKYWIGLLFAPLFVASILSSLLALLLYLPMFQIITLVE